MKNIFLSYNFTKIFSKSNNRKRNSKIYSKAKEKKLQSVFKVQSDKKMNAKETAFVLIHF